MRTITTVRSWRAMTLAALFISGTCYVLFQDILEGARFGPSHVLTFLALVAATAAGHSAMPTLKDGRPSLALGLALVAVVSLIYILTMSGARNAELTATKAALVTTNNAERAKVEADIGTTESDLKAQEAAAVKECKSGPGTKCAGLRTTADRTQSHLRILEARLHRLSPTVAANAGYKHVAKMWTTLTGGDAQRAEAVLLLWMPFIAVVITEMGTIVFLGMGLGHKPAPVDADEPPPAATAPVAAQPVALPPVATASNVIEHPVLVALRKAGRPLSNDELAAAMAVTKGEASKRRREIGHQLIERREGRCLMVAIR